MSIRNLIAAAALAAALPMVFAQSIPTPLRGEAWYLTDAPAPATLNVQGSGARGDAMPELDLVPGEAGYVPHQHQFMEQNALRTRAMGNRGAASQGSGPAAQGPQEVRQYGRAGA